MADDTQNEGDTSTTSYANSLTDTGSIISSTLDSHLDTHLDKVPKAENTPAHVAELPTTTEAPAVAEGDSDRADDPSIDDLGWSEDPKIPIPVLHGTKNEDVWLLVRRMNGSVYHVRGADVPPGQLDFSISDDETFFPDKLRSTVERVYITVIVSVLAGVKQVNRIRSWHEDRTRYFFAAYFVAWFFDYLVPLSLATVIALIVHPPTRRALFPAAPLALIHTTSGKVKEPPAGVVGSTDTVTGAPETFKGLAVEQEASNFVTGVTTIAVGSVTGQGIPAADDLPKNEEDMEAENHPEEVGKAVPNPTQIVSGAAEAQASATGAAAEHDKTKKHVEATIWTTAGPVMHALNDVADTWERFQNALSPTPPFSQNFARIKLAAVVLPLFLVSLFLDERMVYKGTTFLLGAAFFGQPVIDRMVHAHVRQWLDRNIPQWRRYIQLRYSLLRGVPTNAQLAITLLRIGEKNKAPLPPPPPLATQDPPVDGADEVANAHAEAKADDAKPEPKKGSKVVGFLKGTAKAGVNTVLGVDHVKATAGSEPSKTRLGVVIPKNRVSSDGPTRFNARHHGKKGHIVISTAASPALIGFERYVDVPLKTPEPIFSIAIDDIVEIRKVGGLGWKGKLVVGFALKAEVTDGLEIKDRSGRVERLTATKRRDEVFNRLIALSDKHRWEVV